MRQNMKMIKMQNETITEPKKLEMHLSCSYCMGYVPKQKIIKCSVKTCKIAICKACATFIDDLAFCPVCIVKMVKNDTAMLILKANKQKKYK
jgi:hypothetical protein